MTVPSSNEPGVRTTTMLFARSARIAFLPPFILMLALIALLAWQVNALLSAAHWTDHSDQVMAQANRTLGLAADAETRERGYLVGANPVFLQPYFAAQREIGPAFDNLASLVSDNPSQAARAQALRSTYAAWSSYARGEMQLRAHDIATTQAARHANAHSLSTEPSGKFVAFFNQARSKELMDRTRSQFAAFQEVEQRLRAQRARTVQAQARVALTVGVLCVLIVGGLIGITTRRSLISLSTNYEELLYAEQQARERLSTTLKSIGDAVLVTDSRGRVTMMNPIAEALTGWPASEAAGRDAKTIFDIINEATRAVVESPVDRVIREGVIVGLANHTVLKRRDGTEVAIDDSGAPIWDAAGKLSGVVLVFRDITERRELELREHNIAEQLQGALLPILPSAPPGLVLRGHYRAALTEAMVGGDFVDCYPAGEGNLTCLVVGDMSGKGLAAARQVATVRNMVRYALYSNDSLAVAISRLNHILVEQELINGFATLFVGKYAPASGKLTYVNCGQEPGLVWRAGTRTLECLATTGPGLGAFDGGPFDEASIVLGPGDMFALFTDGMTEVGPDRKNLLGIEGLIGLFSESATTESTTANGSALVTADKLASSIVDKLISGVENYAGGEKSLRDDIGLLVGVVLPDFERAAAAAFSPQ